MIENRKSWHALEAEEVLSAFQTTANGLSEEEARRRLELHGPNELSGEERVSPLRVILQQIKSPLIYVLLVAAVISFVLGHMVDAFVILGVVVVNTVIGFIQEYRAERAMEALRQLAAPTALVVRSEERREVPASEIVPGDVVVLAAGDKVPADGRITDSANLKMQESALTGESLGVDKSYEAVAEDTALADRSNLVFAGTSVVYGRGEAVVFATGLHTEVGRIAREVAGVERERTPLEDKLAVLGRVMVVVVLGLTVLILVSGLLRGFSFIEIFLFAVAAAVATIPEGLPAVITIVLAIGLQRMATKHAVIRKLPAVETLGSATVICSDKTGTLTKNEMTVKVIYTEGREYQVTGEGYAPRGEILLEGASSNANALQLLLQAAVLCNDADLLCDDAGCSIQGDPTEAALLTLAAKAGISKSELSRQMPRLDEIPFDSKQAYMATLNDSGDGRVVFVKGAPEKVVDQSSLVLVDGDVREFTEEHKQAVRKVNSGFAARALRVLALAYRKIESAESELTHQNLEVGLVFLGLVGMIDPPRPEALEAIKRCRRAGIRVMMATGDGKITAAAIAEQMGILREGGEVVDGREVQKLSEDELAERVERIDVFARVEPDHKFRIVGALKRRGHIVAMTGDGVNDAPALKRADIGVAMGITGTDVAKEAAEMVLTDDNFASIVAAVEEGRIIFRNIKKVVAHLLSTNAGEQLTIIATIFGGLPLPLVPVQILWINLVTDSFPALALAADPPREDVLDEPPQPTNAKIVSRGLVMRIIYVALISALGTVGLFVWYLQAEGIDKARTVAFAAMAVFQFIHSFNVRSPKVSVFKLGFLSNHWLVLAVAVSFVLQIAAIQLPFMQLLFHTVPLTAAEWLLVTAICSSVLWAEELRKWLAPSTSD